MPHGARESGQETHLFTHPSIPCAHPVPVHTLPTPCTTLFTPAPYPSTPRPQFKEQEAERRRSLEQRREQLASDAAQVRRRVRAEVSIRFKFRCKIRFI